MKLDNIKILYVLNALFFCALIGMFAYILPKSQRQSLATQNIGVPLDASNTPIVASVTVGGNSNDPAAVKVGSISQINGSTLTVKDPATGQVYTIATNADTKIQIEGLQKDQTQYKKEMDAYYAQIKLLIQDPAKNKAALGALTIPDPAESKPGTLADVIVGDTIVVQAAAPILGTSFTAVKIIKPSPVPR